MISCRNCGHGAHCGISLLKNVNTHAELNDGHRVTEQIEVCKYCRCEKCTPLPEWGSTTVDME